MKTLKNRLILLSFLVWLVTDVDGHARLIKPAGRGSMWRWGFDTNIVGENTNDQANNCGGLWYQTSQNGKCGVCGDPYNGDLKHEAGGIYASKEVAMCIPTSKRTLDITVDVTANHLGYFEFKLCPNNDYTKKFTQDCLDQYPLRISGTADEYRNHIGSQRGNVTTTVDLPPGLTCWQCVLQWLYHAGNNEGIDADTGDRCKGCGPQEEFIACSDIMISDNCEGNGQDTENNQPQTTKQPQTQQPWTQQPQTQQPWTQRPWTQRPVTQAATQQPWTQRPTPQATQQQWTPKPWTQRPATQAATPKPWTQQPKPTMEETIGSQGGEDFVTVTSETTCDAIPPYSRVPGMKRWCTLHCLEHFPRYCPKSHCICKEESKNTYWTCEVRGDFGEYQQVIRNICFELCVKIEDCPTELCLCTPR